MNKGIKLIVSKTHNKLKIIVCILLILIKKSYF